MSRAPKEIVIVGSGVTGLVAAYTCCKYGGQETRVTLIEKAASPGGHAMTIAGPNGEKLDIGFMVMNDVTYPNLKRIYAEIGQEVEPSDMSFSIFGDSPKSHSWSFQSNIRWAIRNVFRPRLWRFGLAHSQFAKRGVAYLLKPSPADITMRDFVEGLDDVFVNRWLVPFISAVWSSSETSALDFAALPLLKFMHHHQFLTLDTIRWTTPKGRSETYVQKILEACGPKLVVRVSTAAARVDGERRLLHLEDGSSVRYDSLILACSAPLQAALNPPSKKWLQKFRTNEARVVAHTSPQGMPFNLNDWSAWNVTQPDSSSVKHKGGVRVTYWISKLQNLANPSVFLSLNPSEEPEGSFHSCTLSHPVMDLASYRAASEEHQHQGIHGVFHAGAWLRSGFHEDGCVSGLIAARRALGREDVEVEFPSMSGSPIPARAVLGESVHSRKTPRGHSYTSRFPLYVHKFDASAPPKGFLRTDHFGDPAASIDSAVRRALKEKLGIWPLGRIDVVCNLRFLGVCFNPITPFFAHDEQGRLIALLLEVHNTPWEERCLYAMHVNPDSYSLTPSVHEKLMHVSPFNEPPPSSPDFPHLSGAAPGKVFYKFSLQGESFLRIEVVRQAEPIGAQNPKAKDKHALSGGANNTAVVSKPNEEETILGITREDDELIMSASWKLSSETHGVRSGSLRALALVYFKALVLFQQGLPLFSYEKSHIHWYSPLMLCQGGFLLVAIIHAFAGGSVAASASFSGLGLSLLLHHRAGGVNIVAMAVTIVFTVFCIIANTMHGAASSVSQTDWHLLAFSAFSSGVCYVLSNVSTTSSFDHLRTLCYFNAFWGSFAAIKPMPLPSHVAMAWFTWLVLFRVLRGSGFSHSVAQLIHVGTFLGLVALNVQTVNFTGHVLEDGLLECFNAIFFAHVVYRCLFGLDSFWAQIASYFLFAVAVALHPAARALAGGWTSLAPSELFYSWPVLAILACGLGVQALATAVVRHSSFVRSALERRVVGLLDYAICSSTGGTVRLVAYNGEKTAPKNDGAQTIVLLDPISFAEFILNGELGLGEAYVNEYWTAANGSSLVGILKNLSVLNDSKYDQFKKLMPQYWLRRFAFTSKFGKLDRSQSAQSIAEHYDDGNEFFRAFLGDDMVYTSALWSHDKEDLATAQRAKVDRILDLASVGVHTPAKLLDIGSGWGYLVHAANQRGISATGLCNCSSMVQLASQKFGKDKFKLMDYRDIPLTHDTDAITSVEMIEAVPAKDYPDFVAACDRALKPGGLVVMQVINALAFNNPVARKRNPEKLGTFVTTHIFPGQQLPNLEFLHEAFLQSGKFNRTYSETNGHDYARTLHEWSRNLESHKKTVPPAIYRKYQYYFAFCEAGFATEKLHLTRVVFRKK